MMTEPIIVLLALMPENRIVQGGLIIVYKTGFLASMQILEADDFDRN
mgnify:CR=1 FL=1